MVNKKIIKDWLKMAQEDFDFASANLDNPANTFFSQICFHFQLAAEKYLKAYIIANELEFKKIHDLTELLRICQNHDQIFQGLNEECKFLTAFYIDTRYPVHWPVGLTREDTEKARASAQGIGSFIEKLLELEVT